MLSGSLNFQNFCGSIPPHPPRWSMSQKQFFDGTTNTQRAEYRDKSPSSSLVDIYSLLIIVATFSQAYSNWFVYLLVRLNLYVYSAPVHSHIRIDSYVQEWLVGEEVKTNHNHPSKLDDIQCSVFPTR